MERVETSTAVAVIPALETAGTPGYCTKGNPGGGIPATIPGQDWFNGIQEEIAAVIEGQSITLDRTNLTQLNVAIKKMITDSSKRIRFEGQTFEGSVSDGDAVYYDAGNSRFAKAIADGTEKQVAIGFADVTNTTVYAWGEMVGLLSGLTVGGRYFLDDSTAGAITTTAPANRVSMGQAKSATDFFVDVDVELGQPVTNLQARQTILTASVDSAGQANFLSIGTGLNVDLNAATDNLVAAFAAGFSADGTVDYIAVIAADLTGPFGVLVASDTSYLYMDRNPTTGAITYSKSLLAPEYGTVAPASPASDQHYYHIPSGKMFRYTGTVWEAKQRVFVGEADTDATNVTAVRAYALQGHARLEQATLATSTNYTLNHNLGTDKYEAEIYAECKTAEFGYAVGDRVKLFVNVYTSNRQTVLTEIDQNSVVITTGSAELFSVINRSTFAGAIVTTANWKFGVLVSRGW